MCNILRKAFRAQPASSRYQSHKSSKRYLLKPSKMETSALLAAGRASLALAHGERRKRSKGQSEYRQAVGWCEHSSSTVELDGKGA